jgi:hypothetical protein
MTALELAQSNHVAFSSGRSMELSACLIALLPFAPSGDRFGT